MGLFTENNLDGLKFNVPPFQEPFDDTRKLEPFDIGSKFHKNHPYIRNAKAAIYPSGLLEIEMDVNIKKCKIQKGTRQDAEPGSDLLCPPTPHHQTYEGDTK